MNDKEIVTLLTHLAPEPKLVAITPDEVAVLRGLGYVEERGLSLTPLGHNWLAAQSEAKS